MSYWLTDEHRIPEGESCDICSWEEATKDLYQAMADVERRMTRIENLILDGTIKTKEWKE